MTTAITDLDDFKALDPFFRIIEKGLDGIADGGHFFDLLAENVIFDPVGRVEAVGAAGAKVHLLDDRAVAPPLRDQLRVGPDGEDVRARCIEDPLDADLELARLGDGGLVHLSRPPSSPARSRVAPDGCARRHAVSAYLAG
jgi:hypothetical protein